MRARALIGPTGYGTFGIVWRDFPEQERRGGYSGPFHSFTEAKERAQSIARFWGVGLTVESVANVNELEP